MIQEFLSQKVPPAATVTAEAAKTEKWVERLTAIGTLIASQGVDVAARSPASSPSSCFESGQDVAAGRQAGAARHLGRAGRPRQRQGDAAGSRGRLPAPGRPDAASAVTSEANLDTARAKRDTAAGGRQAHRGRHRAEGDRWRRSPAASASARSSKGQYVSPGLALVSLQALDPIRVDFPMPEQNIGKLARRPDRSSSPSTPSRARCSRARSSRSMRAWRRTRARCWCAASLPNPERKLLPGMFANVAVLAGEPADVVTVPRTAVTYSLYGDSVYVVKPAAAEGGSRRRAKPASRRPALRRRAPLRARPARCARIASPSSRASRPASRWSPPASSSSTPAPHVAIDNTQPLSRPDDAAEAVAEPRPCPSPTSSSAGRCWPPSSAC